MPSATATKRVRGVSIFRPFVFGSEAQPFDPAKKPANAPADHTHQWRVYVKGVNDEDISYWLKKVQFKLHETYAQNIRTIEQPPFEVTETGWGEFEIQIKLYFVPESMEKPQTLWHSLKLHPYGPDAEAMKERRDQVTSQNYEEIVFNEPVEQFHDLLTGGAASAQPQKGKGGKNTKQSGQRNVRTAEIPPNDSPGNPYSKATENKELDRLGEASRTVEQMIKEEKERLIDREKRLAELRESEGVPANTKKR
ncbi:transcription initiation factor IIF, auxiliary subunit [Aspergillus pseudonomiae]|uniref:Protein AF-9 homolog n=2 Tax=Aspergillus subgen. Circumdati TaxID=2720871 RepID=A0A0L1J4Y7_ASPN3|nr:subunit of both the NuA4 histone H4 acetyltransferase complex and the SWR1 complex [Aspergillus nomiae NRRL 13137]XP_031943405.1 transcription initiation factor IIF, auxiliary subunit [Aspergillus pseudonomiae]KAB8264535.1 transcription initiation factor IIF, auxiliary subunit [Aspergillus pseudonomiae]KAE8406086.1 transcription initiation factor IIF, auxiliary subunit [Aspergillus pseudonomiae]KNG86876.1 subunit of both the NuA4 histone H4 acetyltransferase complex and the SWR1 complex [Asp